jgi:hypothetical protein
VATEVDHALAAEIDAAAEADLLGLVGAAERRRVVEVDPQRGVERDVDDQVDALAGLARADQHAAGDARPRTARSPRRRGRWGSRAGS